MHVVSLLLADKGSNNCSLTLYSPAEHGHSVVRCALAGFVNDKDKSFPRQLFAFCVDGIAIVIGSLLGCAPLTVYIESAAGIRWDMAVRVHALRVHALRVHALRVDALRVHALMTDRSP